MTSFQISVTPNRRAAGRFVGKVRRKLQRAFAERQDLSQADIARALGVNRSVVNRQLNGSQDISLGRVAELAWILEREIDFDLKVPVAREGANVLDAPAPPLSVFTSSFSLGTVDPAPIASPAGVYNVELSHAG